jgi:pSer/pThr/pTyr-binding forkhead associated (FHA) protein
MNNYQLTIILNSMVIDSMELNKEEITIGRDPFNDIVIDNPATSRYHATIYIDNGKYVIQDLESSNGTIINNFVINTKILEIGDEILIGKHMIKVNPPKPNGTIIDLAFQSESQYSSAVEGTFMVDEIDRRKVLDKVQKLKHKKLPFLVLQDNRKVYIRDSYFNIGKDKGSNVKVHGFLIKGVQAEIFKLNPGTYKLVSYANFLSPVKINGRTIKEQILNDGDIINIADTWMVYYE